MQHYKSLFAILVLLSASSWSATAQSTYTISETIYFDTDVHAIDERAAAVLRSLAERLNAASDYDLQVEAYTDERGSAEHNFALAENRAHSTIDYLSRLGVLPHQQDIINYGKTRARAESQDEAQRQSDRRVDIHATVYQYESLPHLMQRMKAIGQSTEVINIAPASRGKVLKTAKGTKVYIPGQAFVFKDGTAPKGAIDLMIFEAYEPSDWFINQLNTTTTDGQLLRTGGMLKIDARSQGRPLELAPGKAISFAIPIPSAPVPGMEVYYAAPSENGQAGIQWLPTSSPLGSNQVEEERKREIAAEAERINNTIELRLRQFQFKRPLPNAPQFADLPYPIAPTIKALGKKVQQPVREDFVFKPFNLRSRLYSAKRRQQIETSKYNSALRSYERYEKRRIAYEEALPRYREQKDSFKQAVQVWEAAIQARLIEQFTYELHQWLISEPLLVYQAYTAGGGRYAVECREDDFLQHLASRVAQYFHEQRREEPRSNQASKPPRPYAEYLPLIAGIELPPHQPDWQSHLRKSYDKSFRAAQGQADSTQMRRDLEDELRADLELARMNDKLMEQVEAICSSPEYLSKGLKFSYTASINRLGWINIDVLLRFQPADLIAISVPEPDSAKMMLFLPNLNLVVDATPVAGGHYQATSNLPRNQEAILVSMKLLDGKAQLAIHKFTTAAQPLAPLEYQEMHPRALLRELNRLRS
jgi:hypothetical protein